MNFSTDYDTFLGNVNASSDAKKFDNSTFDDDLSRKNLKFIFDIQAFLSVLIVMLAMGTEIPWDDLWHHIKRPIGMSIGLVSQFILMPLSAFALLLVSGVAEVHATGVLIIACCPGGPLSNMFSYLSGGDLPLSVAMTTASTAMATGMLPGNLWLYGRYFETADLVIPYKKMAVSILIATSPVCVGMLIRWKAPRIAKWITKVQKDIIVLPHVYLFGIVVGCTTLVGGYQLHKRLAQRKPISAIRLAHNKEGNTEDLENEDLMKSKDQDIELRCKIVSSNINFPSRQRNMPI